MSWSILKVLGVTVAIAAVALSLRGGDTPPSYPESVAYNEITGAPLALDLSFGARRTIFEHVGLDTSRFEGLMEMVEQEISICMNSKGVDYYPRTGAASARELLLPFEPFPTSGGYLWTASSPTLVPPAPERPGLDAAGRDAYWGDDGSSGCADSGHSALGDHVTDQLFDDQLEQMAESAEPLIRQMTMDWSACVDGDRQRVLQEMRQTAVFNDSDPAMLAAKARRPRNSVRCRPSLASRLGAV